jgi:hypothetical protein
MKVSEKGALDVSSLRIARGRRVDVGLDFCSPGGVAFARGALSYLDRYSGSLAPEIEQAITSALKKRAQCSLIALDALRPSASMGIH